jgi:acyl carrier protein
MSDALVDLFAEALELDASQLNDETSPENTPEWDSLKAMELVGLIEDEFETSLSTRDIMKMRSIGLARDVLRAKDIQGL